MSWKERYADKLLTPQEAVKLVKSGQRVGIPIGSGEPALLLEALAERREELQGVTVGPFMNMAPHRILEPGMERAFEAWSVYLTPGFRQAYAEKRATFAAPVLAFYPRQEEPGRIDAHKFDIYMLKLSPPDGRGFCSFGNAVWYSKSSLRKADVVVAEVTEGLIRTGGDNYVHIDEVDYLVEGGGSQPRATRQLSEEREGEIGAIGQLVNTLVKDGDTIQFGGGSVSSNMTGYLRDKVDLGVHTEASPPGVMDLVKSGAVTGKRKTINRGKVVASSLFHTPEDASFVDGNPMFELYEVHYTNSLTTLAQIDNFVSINNALMIDLQGQVTAESFGANTYTGPGGQFEFALGGLMSKGGRSITVMPSTARGGTITRIVPTLPEGCMVTVPRSYVDFVVTEYGIVNLQGTTERRRAELLISIAHPDHRAELRKAARKLFWGD